MPHRRRNRIAVLFCAVGLLAGCKEKAPDVYHLIPREIHGWRVAGEDRVYNRQTIFDYLDGAGEVYLAYDFHQVFARTYERDGEAPLLVDIFDMGCSADAFGIFSFERENEDQTLGQGSEYSGGLLRFWKGRFFVSILARRETAASRAAVMALGRAVDRAIPETGSPPALLRQLPPEGLLPNSVRYFHQHTSLNYHYFLSDQNLLNLGTHTEAVLARYSGEEGKVYLLLVQYENPAQAQAAAENFLRHYLPEGQEAGLAQCEDGQWVGIRSRDQRVAVVLEAHSPQQAQALMNASLKEEEKP